jgi:transcriptional regulator with XRE-family HTH domain
MAFKRHRLTQRRLAVGLSQEGLADVVHVDRKTVGRWEAGRGEPQPWMRPRLARALKVSLDDLDDLLTDISSEVASAHSDAVDHALRHQSGASLAVATALRERLDDLCDRYEYVPSAVLLAEATEHLSAVRNIADGARPGRIARELRVLQADVSRVLGQLVWDASQRRDHAPARAFYDQSVSVARDLGDPALEGHALLRTGYLTLYGARDPRSALDVFEQAASIAEPASRCLAGLALLHAGEAQAMLGHSSQCDRALAAAERHLDRALPTDIAIDLISPVQISRLAGSCYLTLGRLERARQLLERTADNLQARRKSRAIVLGNLAITHIRQRNIDAAAQILNEAIAEVEETRGGGALNVVFAAGRELRPWWTHPLVADVHDRLLALLATP